MIILTVLLLTLSIGLYFVFRARAEWKKRTVDELVGSLHLLHESGKYAEFDEIYRHFRDFGRVYCVGEPIFHVEEHFNQAVRRVLGLRESRAEEPLINVPKRVRRIGAHKVRA
jgi:hypothetical protein